MTIKKMTPPEAVADAVKQLQNDDTDVMELLDEYEVRLFEAAASRGLYIVAAKKWREDINERLMRLEELVAELPDK